LQILRLAQDVQEKRKLISRLKSDDKLQRLCNNPALGVKYIVCSNTAVSSLSLFISEPLQAGSALMHHQV
jgi:hypothetical protein